MFKVVSIVSLIILMIPFTQAQSRRTAENVPCCNSKGEHPTQIGAVCKLYCEGKRKKMCDGNICIGDRVKFAHIRSNAGMGGKVGTVINLVYGPGMRRKGLMIAQVSIRGGGDIVGVRSKYLIKMKKPRGVRR